MNCYTKFENNAFSSLLDDFDSDFQVDIRSELWNENLNSMTEYNFTDENNKFKVEIHISSK